MHKRTQDQSAVRVVAIDWSGDCTECGQREKIWIADWRDDIVSLENGRTREEVSRWVIHAARETPEMSVGLDFAFSLPAWFLEKHGCAGAYDFWQLAAREGERWLSLAKPPFWGRGKGSRCPEDHRAPSWRGFRRTDRDICIGGIQPKSPFQIGGAGSVGTGSVRGMPLLLVLRDNGFSIWPFDTIRLPVVLEVYPRIFTGAVVKSSAAARSRHLLSNPFSLLSEDVLARARFSEDAFDALCAAMGMAASQGSLSALKRSRDSDVLLEGAIWVP